jgi:methylmalonyl-CoA mutase cobalamin-binding subunit
MTTKDFLEEYSEVNGTKVRITTYKIGNEFHCHVANADPGATIARTSAASKEDAVSEAIKKASERIVIKGKSL